MAEAPIDGVTLKEAALILGCSAQTAERLLSVAGLLDQHPLASRADVERIAMEVYRWRQHYNDEAPYWIAGARAARIIGVNRSRLRALAAAGLVPHETTSGGARLYRREQLEVVANARRVRWARYQRSPSRD